MKIDLGFIPHSVINRCPLTRNNSSGNVDFKNYLYLFCIRRRTGVVDLERILKQRFRKMMYSSSANSGERVQFNYIKLCSKSRLLKIIQIGSAQSAKMNELHQSFVLHSAYRIVRYQFYGERMLVSSLVLLTQGDEDVAVITEPTCLGRSLVWSFFQIMWTQMVGFLDCTVVKAYVK